jgi:hypothetical protein
MALCPAPYKEKIDSPMKGDCGAGFPVCPGIVLIYTAILLSIAGCVKIIPKSE